MHVATQSSPGELFHGRYELGSTPLGVGHAGEVWPALDTHRGWQVALKILRNAEADDAWQEASRLTSLESPNILKVNNADLAVDVPFIDSELATHGTAADEMRAYGVAPRRAIHLTRGVLTALELCHERGILHRDVKPANIFIGDTGDARLGDFGCAGLMGADGRAKATGDPDIRPLDVLKGLHSSASADVYATGLSLYAMLTGALPFSIVAAGGFAEHRDQVASGMPDIREVVPHVTVGLAKVVRRATAPTEAHRFASAAEFSAALANLRPLPADVARVRPSDPLNDSHTDHLRCWRAIRRADEAVSYVCELRDDKKFAVLVTRESGNRYRRLCRGGMTAAQSAVHLRSVFTHFV